MNRWRPIATAPRDGTRIIARQAVKDTTLPFIWRMKIRKTFWGKTSHVPLYGWNWGRDPENQNLWDPTEWKPE